MKPLTCHKRLSDINLSKRPKCLFCNEIDDIRHFLVFCPKGSQFLEFLLPVVEQNGRFRNSSRLWLSGRMHYLWLSPQGGDLWSPKYFFILNAKYYIHNKRLVDDNNIEFLHFLYELKFKLDMEHKICKMNNTTQTFKNFVFLYDQMWYQHILLMK